jgi:hypothetical protein
MKHESMHESVWSFFFFFFGGLVHQIGSKIKHTRRPLATGLYTVLCMGLEFLLSILRVVGARG